MSEIIKANGFTNETLEWDAWLDVIQLEAASEDQVKVLEESHPKAKTSDYYLFLAHQPDILRQRSAAFNAIMYAPGGLSRAERELGSLVVRASMAACIALPFMRSVSSSWPSATIRCARCSIRLTVPVWMRASKPLPSSRPS